MASLHVEVHGASPRVICRVYTGYFRQKRTGNISIWVEIESPYCNDDQLSKSVRLRGECRLEPRRTDETKQPAKTAVNWKINDFAMLDGLVSDWK